MTDLDIFHDHIVGVVIATEVPPFAQPEFSDTMISIALLSVAQVIWNRARNWKLTPVEVVLQKNQFSAVCREDYWRKAMAGLWCPKHVETAVAAWRSVIAKPLLEVGNSMWYYSPVSMVPNMRVPSWVEGKQEHLVPGLNPDYFRFYAE